MAVQGELPVWVSGQQLWVRGLDKKTTCNDVIKALLGHQDDNYIIVERWRRVERPLNGDTRLLKLWTTWGDAQDEVKLSLKRISDDDSGRGSPTSYTRRKKHHYHHHHSYKNHHRQQQITQTQSQTIHPKRLQQISKTQNIERLLKLILVQGETIQNQLQKLHEREDQIEHLEDEKHQARVNLLGSNYVLETYLGNTNHDDINKSDLTKSRTRKDGDEEKENDSGITTEHGPSSSENTSNTPTTEDTKEEEEEEEDEDFTTIEEELEAEIKDLQKRIDLWEKVLKVNKKLEKEEETLVRLYVSVRKCDELNELKTELDRKGQEIDINNKELEKFNHTLNETDVALNARRKYLKRLQTELEASDLETEMLLKATEVKNNRNQKLLKSTTVYIDSNSDTGLSSLHSCSEEGTYILDTLV